MAHGTGPTVKNVKGSFRLSNSVHLNEKANELELKEYNIKRFHNFFVLRSQYVYIVFYSGFVNVTGVKAIEEFPISVTNFLNIFDFENSDIIEPPKIDNLTASGLFNINPMFLSKLANCFHKEDGIVKVTYKPVFFPSVIVKYITIGTIMIYGSGRYNIVGSKSVDCIKEVHSKTIKILDERYNNIQK
jgi:TATA-box binding protein (TBP) (component of TFIID and TFIIIB)